MYKCTRSKLLTAEERAYLWLTTAAYITEIMSIGQGVVPRKTATPIAQSGKRDCFPPALVALGTQTGCLVSLAAPSLPMLLPLTYLSPKPTFAMPAAPTTSSEPPMPAAPTQLSTFQLHTASPELVMSHQSKHPGARTPHSVFGIQHPSFRTKPSTLRNSEPALLQETTKPTLGLIPSRVSPQHRRQPAYRTGHHGTDGQPRNASTS